VLPRLLGRADRERVLFAATVWRSFFLLVAASTTAAHPMLLAFLLQEIGFGLSEPVFQAWLNEHVPPERRATLISVRSMFGTLGGGIGLVAVGWVARSFGIPAAWATAAAVFALAAPGFLLLARMQPRRGAVEPLPSPEPVPAKPVPPTA
ncbi:MAG: MFS transporter, partial [Candidatus Binatia bacterium]